MSNWEMGINEPLNFNDELLEGGSSYPILKHFSKIFAIITFGIKIYLIFELWKVFPSVDVYDYLKPLFKEDFYLSVNGFIDKCISWIGMIILTLEPIYQLYMKFSIYNSNMDTSRILNFFQLSYFIFPFIHGFFPQLSFKINNIDISKDQNFFVTIFKAKTYVQNIFIIVILVCLGCVMFAICCGKGEKIGTWKTITTYASGRESVNYRSAYGPDYEGAALFCSTGYSCGFLLVLCALLIFPIFVGTFAYVYNLCYMDILLLQICYVLDFCLNILYINFYTMYYIY